MEFDYSRPHRIVNGEPVLLTTQEIAERQAEEAAYAAQAPARAIALIDAQMTTLEQAKMLGRTTREDMLARWVRDYVRVAHPEVNPFSVTSLAHPLALEAFAAFADSNSVYYNAGVGRLKAFDDGFVTLRAQRTQLQQSLPPH